MRILLLTILSVKCVNVQESILSSHKKHMMALGVSNSEIKKIQLDLMNEPVTPFRDPMIDDYDKLYKDTPKDIENDENTLKEVANINTPVIIRVKATPELYRKLLMH